jgi:hypothetical protein
MQAAGWLGELIGRGGRREMAWQPQKEERKSTFGFSSRSLAPNHVPKAGLIGPSGGGETCTNVGQHDAPKGRNGNEWQSH